MSNNPESYDRVVRGKLSLKSKLRPKKRKKNNTVGDRATIDEKEQSIADFAMEAMTPAERELERVRQERESKMEHKSFRRRLDDYNEHLASLSEHHDIPKVGPG